MVWGAVGAFTIAFYTFTSSRPETLSCWSTWSSGGFWKTTRRNNLCRKLSTLCGTQVRRAVPTTSLICQQPADLHFEGFPCYLAIGHQRFRLDLAVEINLRLIRFAFGQHPTSLGRNCRSPDLTKFQMNDSIHKSQKKLRKTHHKLGRFQY